MRDPLKLECSNCGHPRHHGEVCEELVGPDYIASVCGCRRGLLLGPPWWKRENKTEDRISEISKTLEDLMRK